MSVLDRFARPIPDQEKQRGERFVQNGDVDIHLPEDGLLRGMVFDNQQRFDTAIPWNGGSGTEVQCQCDVFRSGEICGHLVGTALRAQKEGLMPRDGEKGHQPQETMPRRRARDPMWLSSTGQIRRATDADEPRPAVRHEPSQPSWKKQMARLKESAPLPPGDSIWPAGRVVLYVLDVPASLESRSLVIRLAARDRKTNGQWSKPKTRGLSFPDLPFLPDADDQQILALLKGGTPRHEYQFSYDPTFRVPDPLQRMLLPMICKTGRALIAAEPDTDELAPLEFDEGGAWEFRVEARRDETAQHYVFAGLLRRGEEQVPVLRPLLTSAGGLVIFDKTLALLDHHDAHHWLLLLRNQKSIVVPFAQSDELLHEMLQLAHLPPLDLPPELQVETVQPRPRPRLRIRTPGRDEFRPERLRGELSFDYDDKIVRHESDPPKTVFQQQRRRLVIRDLASERLHAQRLNELGLREAADYSRGGPEFWFNRKHLPRIIRMLAIEKWHIEAEGKLYRQSASMKLRVSSGIDWFELRGDVDFDGQTASFPEVLSALRKGQTTITLADGTVGLLPETWLKKYGLLASIGTEEEEFLKFSTTQAGLLDALLASQPEATWDEAFERTRAQLRDFDGVEALSAPEEFVGELRAYQKEGLGWFRFLERFGFGGCLADDMGLGKTVQVLALLASREKRNPSLVVVPKSLVFNWQQESAKFTPKLRILDHTGIDRLKATDHLSDYDLVITTYGTLRRDAAFLKDVEFDYVILDEAQAIKNPASESAKAIRLVKGRQRLALSGTPVQNHLGDLWSLFDFLNPGMLGHASVFSGPNGSLRNPDEPTRVMLSRALRPFILRRTKEQVAADLPAKHEQTLYCELEPPQRKLYDELRAKYRQELLQQIDKHGLARSKIQILEALLRLRQAALHPGLIDPARVAEPSAKMDLLLPSLEEIIEEGHKALVFSQFTSMLSIVRAGLEQKGIVYEYLDGKTRDRQERIERFQSDAKCPLFLISLKAGGLGLNLTAADYVYLLDPWWNPAIETQAIDRAHRIGQDKPVHACRLIAKDTVEEKVLSLQQSKRSLADAIITADNSLLKSIAREDLELLLS
jgi:superfamily II DNA or RNA helicase